LNIKKRRKKSGKMAKATLEIDGDLELSNETWDALLSYTTEELRVVRTDVDESE
jgi:hypothetical protein